MTSTSGNAPYLAAAAQAIGLWEGQVLAGKYRVERLLGAGGMGVVVSARHLQLDERVAIKLLHSHVASHPKALSRFAREARAAAKIKSEHAAWVSDVGTLSSGTPYMVMEHLDGLDLAAWLRERGALSSALAMEFLLQACEAIAVAHANGIVHRDLKPANLFITRRVDGTSCLKVLDFGISRVESDVSMTQTAQVLGSPLYMSPEQLSAPESVDARSDIWSLGVILFELLSGFPPFAAATLPELVARIQTQPPAALPNVATETDRALEVIIHRCLEKERSFRFASVAELAAAFSPFAPTSARVSIERIAGILRAPVSTEFQSAFDETVLALEQPTPAAPSRHRPFVIALGALAVSALAVVLFARASSDHDAQHASASAGVLPEVPASTETAQLHTEPAWDVALPPLASTSAPAPRVTRAAPSSAMPVRSSLRTAKPSPSVSAAPAAAIPSREPAPPIDPFEDRK